MDRLELPKPGWGSGCSSTACTLFIRRERPDRARFMPVSSLALVEVVAKSNIATNSAHGGVLHANALGLAAVLISISSGAE